MSNDLQTRHASYLAQLRDALRYRAGYCVWSFDADGHPDECIRVHWSLSARGRADMRRAAVLCTLLRDVRERAAEFGVSLTDTRSVREVLLPIAWTWGQTRGAA